MPEVLPIAFTAPHWERKQLARVWKIDALSPVPMVQVETTRFVADPVTVYRLIKFYVENAADRAELGNAATLQRRVRAAC